MFLIMIAIFFTLTVIVRSYTHIDSNQISNADVLKAVLPAMIAIMCLVLRENYFALPENAMVTGEYLTYRKLLLWGFLGLMGYIVRAAIYGCVFIYRKRG